MYPLLLLIAPVLYQLAHASQPDAASPVSAPLRPLQFGQLNFLHTTDTHGWHAGHLLEPSYSADWGDYIDFSINLRAKLEAEGKDLLVVDTGDRIEGNGLYDASDPRGRYTFPIITNQHIDLICIGNHELYKSTSANDELNITVPAYKDNYLASNLDILDPATGRFVPLAQRYKKFTTPKQGITILSFGFLFDFTSNSANSRVTPVAHVVQQPWFLDAIADQTIDLFVVIGHIGLRQGDFDIIYQVICPARPHTPIQFLGGHFHIRDYRVFDQRAHALASGRFMETVGFQSISGLNTSEHSNPTTSPTFFRRYINSNLYSFYRHTHQGPMTFHTPLGLNTTREITAARRALSLDETYGCAPQDYWMSRAPYPHPSSIFSLLTEQVFQSLTNPAHAHKDRLIIANTGAIRFDIFRGRFTRDSTYIVSPFTSRVMYIPDVPWSVARRVLPILNQGEQVLDASQLAAARLDLEDLRAPEQRTPALHQMHWSHATTQAPLLPDAEQEHAYWPSKDRKPRLTPGYTTRDDLGNDGDDTVHTPIDFFQVPNCVQTTISHSSRAEDADDWDLLKDKTVDFVFNEFLQPYVLFVLNLLGGKLDERTNYSDADVLDYLPGQTFTSALATFVANEWGGNC